VSGTSVVDDAGAIVILRGANVAGNAKVPPFVGVPDPTRLDQLAGLGMNVIRLLFTWEAYEGTRGQYDEAYLAQLVKVAQVAAARGIYVIVDFHQDAFARVLVHGCGEGFPSWAVSSDAHPSQPDNGPACANWQTQALGDPDVPLSFHDFYADKNGVRTSYLAMLRRVSSAFAPVEGVLGYDLLNEPYGDEMTELPAFYADAAVALRAAHPKAILLVEPNVLNSPSIQDTNLPRPSFDNFVYAPHFYDLGTFSSNAWNGDPAPTHAAFALMSARAATWGVPLFVGEFGLGATATNASGYIAAQYDALDAAFASGTQWDWTPNWTPDRKDGWDVEDLSIIDDKGALRPNYKPRPFLRRVAGKPDHFTVTANPPTIDAAWTAVPAAGVTEIVLPPGWFGGSIASDIVGGSCSFATGNVIVARCTASAPGMFHLTWSRKP
jgi:endoglycosylceramidase